jgi:hypothetical protein
VLKSETLNSLILAWILFCDHHKIQMDSALLYFALFGLVSFGLVLRLAM